MRLVTQAAFARELGLTRQAIYEMKKKGKLTLVKKGKKMLIDFDGYETIKYMKNNNCQRKAIQVVRFNEIKTKAQGKSPEEIAKLLKESEVLKLIYEKAKAEAKQKEVEKRELELLYRRGELISRDSVYESVMYFLDRVIRGMELIGNTFLSDIGDLIVTAGKVTPKIRQRWIDMVVKHIDDAKNETIKYIQKIEKEQQK